MPPAALSDAKAREDELLLERLDEKRLGQAGKFSNSQHCLRYDYVFTPTGFAEKAALTGHFLKREMEEYEALKIEREAPKAEYETTGNEGNQRA